MIKSFNQNIYFRSKIMQKMKVWLISADMGYGHQRAAHSLRELAEGKIISIGTDEFTSKRNKRKWAQLQKTYEFVSRNKKFTFIGKYLYKLMNSMQSIPEMYPIKNRTKTNFATKLLYKYIKNGLYDNLLEIVKQKNIPILTTFYAPSIALEYFGFENIYTIVTDSDINRVWAAAEPQKSKIKYFTPCENASKRMIQYGIKPENIFMSGFPIDLEDINRQNYSTVEERLIKRLKKLDPAENFSKIHSGSVDKILNVNLFEISTEEPIIITFAIGGAGAQKELARKIIFGLKEKLSEGKVKLNLVAGTRKEVYKYFNELIDFQNMISTEIIYSESKDEYFHKFNKVIGETDILWTKPSELIFYSSLGIPVILSPSIGAQEEANRRWLRDEIGSGIIQKKPKYCSQWIDNLLNSGRLAEAAWLGYLKIERNGVKNIINNLEKWNKNEN